MSVHSLELQLAAAVQRFNGLQRRVESEPGSGKGLLSRALVEIEKALEELRVAQEQLVENRQQIAQVQNDLTVQCEKYWQLFNELPQPYVVTSPDTTIAEANLAAADLLNIGQRFLVGKPLSLFVCENRSGFLLAVQRAAASAEPTEMTLRIRPRERAPLQLSATVRGGDSLRWLFAGVAG